MLNLEETREPVRTKWISLSGHLEGVEFLVKLATTLESLRFRNRLASKGIINPTRDNPLNVAMGRESAFFQALAEEYVLDWRGEIAPKGTPYDSLKMGAVLGAYRSAFDAVMEAVAAEQGFFGPGTNGSMPS